MRESNGPARLSIVTPFYNEGAEVSRFLDRLTAVLATIDLNDEPMLHADEIDDDFLTRRLPSEMIPSLSPRTQMHPQLNLLWGHGLA